MSRPSALYTCQLNEVRMRIGLPFKVWAANLHNYNHTALVTIMAEFEIPLLADSSNQAIGASFSKTHVNELVEGK